MAMSLDRQMETETTIRWDMTGGPATLWTANPAVRKEWASYGFVITPTPGGGWRTEVPVDRIGYKPLAGSKR